MFQKFDIFIYINIEQMKQYKYHYFYRIENLIDGKFYYGIHSTDNLEDGYMGSGHRLKEAMKIFGKENFKKNVIKHFETREKASEYEALMVTENLVHDRNCYNVKCGGDYGTTSGTILVKDKNDKWFRVASDDERYLNGELCGVTKGLVPAYSLDSKKYELISLLDYYKNKDKYITSGKGKIAVRDKDGKTFSVDTNDERYLDGELTPIWAGKHHTKDSRIKMHETHKKNGHQQGEKNSSYGTCWITKNEENKKIKKSELSQYISNGWKLGRYISEVKRKTDVLDSNKVAELYKQYKSWDKVSKELNIARSTLKRYRDRIKGREQI